MDLKRRIFLSAAAVATAACSRAPRIAPSLLCLTTEQAETLESWVDTLIPADHDPGAKDSGVVIYIDRQLTRKFKKHQQAYRDALTAIERIAVSQFRRPLPALPVEERAAILSALESGKAPRELFPDGGKSAFEMVLAHTMQGFYGSPRHGGNRDYASWRMVGVPPMPVRGRQHYSITQTFPEKS